MSMGAEKQEVTMVVVSDWVWHEALRQLDPYPVWPDRNDIPVGSATDLPRSLVEEILAYLSEDLTCDHAVNICMCGAAEVVRELSLNLDGKETCPTCGGEGYNWDQAAFDKARSEQIAAWGGQELFDIGESAGYVPCGQCNKEGVVRQDDVLD